MKEIAILSLTRFGDLIQETPLFRILKERWPAARVTLVVEDRFAGLLPMIRGVDRVILMAKERLADQIVFSPDPLVPYFSMEEFVRQLEETEYDLVINLTFSQMSAFIASLMHGKKKVGLSAGRKGERLILSPWALYLFTNQEGNNRVFNRLNLVDHFTLLGGVTPDGRPVELHETERGKAFAESFLAGKGLAGGRFVGLQMGASDPIRCWPPEYFARLSDMLVERMGTRTILFGGPGEEQLANRALSAMRHPAVSAVGATSIEELFSLVKRSSLLVTNDTGTMHFAAAGRVPSLMLCIGPAIFHGTGPYSEGNCAMQADIPCAPCRYNFNCPDPVCREMLTADAVFQVCRDMLEERRGCESVRGIKVYRSQFDGDGFLTWQRWDGGDHGEDDMASRYSRMWRECLKNGSPPPQHAGSIAKDVEEVARLALKGGDISRRIAMVARRNSPPLDEMRRLGEAESEVAGTLKISRSLEPENAPLIDFFSLMRDNIVAEDLQVIAGETLRCYRWLGYLASRL
jgi:ADP-heptose:LPS heptosyltransferase